MGIEIGIELSYFHSYAMAMYFRAFEAKHTAVSYSFMPKLPLTQTRLVIKSAKNGP